MALQGSGPISISQIRTELIGSTTSYSLRTLSAAASKAAPDAMSEFYGYAAPLVMGYYIVGAGGAVYGGSSMPGGGGGGQVVNSTYTVTRGLQYSVKVGVSYQGIGNSSMQQSLIGTPHYAYPYYIPVITAGGGGSGGEYGQNGHIGYGGSGGGGGGGYSTGAGGSGIGGGGNGGNSCCEGDNAGGGGGGGGAGGGGGNGASSTPGNPFAIGGNGGPGVYSSFTGTNIARGGGGGGGGAGGAGSNGVGTGANTGGGCNGQGGFYAVGDSGVVILRTSNTQPTATFSGAILLEPTGYKVYVFNGDGTITFN